jgi:hypothetical protein
MEYPWVKKSFLKIYRLCIQISPTNSRSCAQFIRKPCPTHIHTYEVIEKKKKRWSLLSSKWSICAILLRQLKLHKHRLRKFKHKSEQYFTLMGTHIWWFRF